MCCKLMFIFILPIRLLAFGLLLQKLSSSMLKRRSSWLGPKLSLSCDCIVAVYCRWLLQVLHIFCFLLSFLSFYFYNSRFCLWIFMLWILCTILVLYTSVFRGKCRLYFLNAKNRRRNQHSLYILTILAIILANIFTWIVTRCVCILCFFFLHLGWYLSLRMNLCAKRNREMKSKRCSWDVSFRYGYFFFSLASSSVRSHTIENRGNEHQSQRPW